MTSRKILETKYRISETAMALFLKEGYANVTVEAVAEASSVSRRTVFRHFESKDELVFPDHTERLGLVERCLVESAPGTDPVDAVIAATEESLRDFLSRPELVLRRYKLTRVVPELRKREVIEHERYVALTRSYLRDHLPPDAPPFQSMALAALIDAIHRSALGNWVRGGGGPIPSPSWRRAWNGSAAYGPPVDLLDRSAAARGAPGHAADPPRPDLVERRGGGTQVIAAVIAAASRSRSLAARLG